MMKKYQVILEAADAALENRNNAESIFDTWYAVKNFIPEHLLEAAATSLADTISPDWRRFLENVNHDNLEI